MCKADLWLSLPALGLSIIIPTPGLGPLCFWEGRRRRRRRRRPGLIDQPLPPTPREGERRKEIKPQLCMWGSRGMYVIMLKRGKELIELAGFFVSSVHTHPFPRGKRLFCGKMHCVLTFG